MIVKIMERAQATCLDRPRRLPPGGGGLAPALGPLRRQPQSRLDPLLPRRGREHVEAIGTLAFGSDAPMRRDTIFRLASMTKPVTAVGAMILVEECQLRLDDPVDEWLPELKDRQVLRTIESPLDDTVPARAPDHAARPAHVPLGLRRTGLPRAEVPPPEAMSEARLP